MSFPSPTSPEPTPSTSRTYPRSLSLAERPRTPIPAHRLAKMASALGVFTPVPPQLDGLRSPSGSSTSFSSSTTPSRYLLTVIPPTHLPHDTDYENQVTPLPSSASGYHSQFRRGTLVALYPTLQSQLAAIAKEYALPSTGGMVLYLISPNDNSLGPRISDEAWKLLWHRVLRAEREEHLANSRKHSGTRTLSLASSARSSPGGFDSPIPSRSGTPSNLSYPSPSTSSDEQGDIVTAWSDFPGSLLSPTSLLPILAKVEFDIDRGRALWYEPWRRRRLQPSPSLVPGPIPLQLSTSRSPSPHPSFNMKSTPTPTARDKGYDEARSRSSESDDEPSEAELELGYLPLEEVQDISGKVDNDVLQNNVPSTPAIVVDSDNEDESSDDGDLEATEKLRLALQNGADPLGDVFPSDAATWSQMSSHPQDRSRHSTLTNTLMATPSANLEDLSTEGDEGSLTHDEAREEVEDVVALWKTKHEPTLPLPRPSTMSDKSTPLSPPPTLHVERRMGETQTRSQEVRMRNRHNSDSDNSVEFTMEIVHHAPVHEGELTLHHPHVAQDRSARGSPEMGTTANDSNDSDYSDDGLEFMMEPIRRTSLTQFMVAQTSSNISGEQLGAVEDNSNSMTSYVSPHLSDFSDKGAEIEEIEGQATVENTSPFTTLAVAQPEMRIDSVVTPEDLHLLFGDKYYYSDGQSMDTPTALSPSANQTLAESPTGSLKNEHNITVNERIQEDPTLSSSPSAHHTASETHGLNRSDDQWGSSYPPTVLHASSSSSIGTPSESPSSDSLFEIVMVVDSRHHLGERHLKIPLPLSPPIPQPETDSTISNNHYRPNHSEDLAAARIALPLSPPIVQTPSVSHLSSPPFEWIAAIDLHERLSVSPAVQSFPDSPNAETSHAMATQDIPPSPPFLQIPSRSSLSNPQTQGIHSQDDLPESHLNIPLPLSPPTTEAHLETSQVINLIPTRDILSPPLFTRSPPKSPVSGPYQELIPTARGSSSEPHLDIPLPISPPTAEVYLQTSHDKNLISTKDILSPPLFARTPPESPLSSSYKEIIITAQGQDGSSEPHLNIPLPISPPIVLTIPGTPPVAHQLVQGTTTAVNDQEAARNTPLPVSPPLVLSHPDFIGNFGQYINSDTYSCPSTPVVIQMFPQPPTQHSNYQMEKVASIPLQQDIDEQEATLVSSPPFMATSTSSENKRPLPPPLTLVPASYAQVVPDTPSPIPSSLAYLDTGEITSPEVKRREHYVDEPVGSSSPDSASSDLRRLMMSLQELASESEDEKDDDGSRMSKQLDELEKTIGKLSPKSTDQTSPTTDQEEAASPPPQPQPTKRSNDTFKATWPAAPPPQISPSVPPIPSPQIHKPGKSPVPHLTIDTAAGGQVSPSPRSSSLFPLPPSPLEVHTPRLDEQRHRKLDGDALLPPPSLQPYGPGATESPVTNAFPLNAPVGRQSGESTRAPSSRFSTDSMSEDGSVQHRERANSIMSVKGLRNLWRKSGSGKVTPTSPGPFTTLHGKEREPISVPPLPTNPTGQVRKGSGLEGLQFDQESRYPVHRPTSPSPSLMSPAPDGTFATPISSRRQSGSSRTRGILKAWPKPSSDVGGRKKMRSSIPDPRSSEDNNSHSPSEFGPPTSPPTPRPTLPEAAIKGSQKTSLSSSPLTPTPRASEESRLSSFEIVSGSNRALNYPYHGLE